MKEYDIFLFDADGTLFDYDMAENNALKIMFGYHNFAYTEDIRSKYREINSALWKSYERCEISTDELQKLRFLRLFDSIGFSCDAEEFNKKYLNELGKGNFLIDGALEICQYIFSRNKQIYIVTNGMLAIQKSRIESSPLKKYISEFFASESIGFQKPRIEYFDYVFSHISLVDKDKILIIGDSLSADISGGNNAGIDSCWLNISRATNSTNIVPTYEIFALSDLHKFID